MANSWETIQNIPQFAYEQNPAITGMSDTEKAVEFLARQVMLTGRAIHAINLSNDNQARKSRFDDKTKIRDILPGQSFIHKIYSIAKQISPYEEDQVSLKFSYGAISSEFPNLVEDFSKWLLTMFFSRCLGCIKKEIQ